MKRVVAYYRVSTAKQARSGLGLEAQKEMVRKFCERENMVIIHEMKEQASGGDNDRPVLNEAVKICQRRRLALCVAKVDRLSRDFNYCVTFETRFDIKVYFAQIGLRSDEAVMRQMYMIFAEYERNRIRKRNKESIAERKMMGTYHNDGNPRMREYQGKGVEAAAKSASEFRQSLFAELEVIFEDMKEDNIVPTWENLCKELNDRAFYTRRGKPWVPRNLQVMWKTKECREAKMPKVKTCRKAVVG